MKLRLRSLQSKETVKLEVSDQCTLQRLKEILSRNLSSSSSLASSLRFSLNRKDELSSPSPQHCLLSFGITSGDLIYFSLNPDEFSSSSSPQTLESGSKECEISEKSEFVDLNSPNRQTRSLGITSSAETLIQNLSQSKMQEENPETQELADGEGMDIDTLSANSDGKRISEPNFLKKIFREEIVDDFSDNKLLFIAIHAVFLESGFIGFDPVSGLRVDLFHLLQEQSLMTFTTSVSYTLPELLSDDNVTESIVLNFQTLGHYVNVYGFLAKSQSVVHKLNLNKCKFLPTIAMVWATFDNSDRLNEKDGSSISYAESVVFEFWKMVKDQLALPLLIDLCEKTGLNLPLCLMLLPADLKLRILEALPGQDISRMACVCKEMRYLSSNNELWKEKFAEEFESVTGARGTTNWKARFISSWKNMKKRKRRLLTPIHSLQVLGPEGSFRVVRDGPGAPLPVIGGEYDRHPIVGGPALEQYFAALQRRRRFI